MTRPLLRMILAVLVAGLAGWGFIGQDFVLNPVGEWIPVVSEFLLAGGRPTSAGDPGPPFTRIDSRFPSIPSAWEMLKPLAAVKDKAYGEDEPLISGWRVWTQPDPNNRDRLLSGLEVKRSDRNGAAAELALPVVAVERGRPIPVGFKVEIWGRHRLTGRDDRQYFPADAEYQEVMKRKIQVVDFLLAVHKLEGEFGHEHMKNRAQAEPYRVIGRFRGGLDNSLAAYEAASYELPATDDYLGELRLEMSLRFPESERGQASAYDVPVKVCLRFICGSKVRIRVISDAVKKIDKR